MKEEKAKKRKDLTTLIAYTCICIGVIFVVLVLDFFEVFDSLELRSQDMRFRMRGIESHSDDVVIVAIDPQTLDLLGLIGMPSRDLHVPVIENLFMAGAKAVMFDVLFLTYTGEMVQDQFTILPSPEDSLLAEMLQLYPETVIGRKIKVQTGKSTQQTVGESPYPPQLFQNPDQLAFVDMYLDGDSFIRRTGLVAQDAPPELGWNYSFALKAAMFAIGADTAWVDTKKHKAYVGDRVIPLNEENFMIINFPMDEETFQNSGGYISYEQVMDDSEWGIGVLMENDRFKDKVVMIGAAWPESGDQKNTPFYRGTNMFTKNEYPMYGVHVHKSIVSTILNERYIYPYTQLQYLILIVLMAILATAINWRFRGFFGLILSGVIILVYAALAVYLFIGKRWLVPIIAPAFVTVTVNYISSVTYNFLMERRQKAMIRGAFAQYVPPAVVSELLKNPEMLTLGGEERVMSVIFSDVAGFTTISEGLTPTQLVELLNEYLTAMTNIVLKYDGIIDKYEGDAIMAEFGAPLVDPDHALKACYTALEMQEKLVELREKLKSEGKSPLYARVGINSGPMVIGNMGSEKIFDYTVMGDNVNLSSRLEGANKVYSTYIMCSEATRKMTGDNFVTRELDLIRVKGKTEGVLVHEILARKETPLDDKKRRMIELYNDGLLAYKEWRWDDGAELFEKALEIDPDDGPSALYLQRCNEFRENPPAEDWDGIFTMRTK